MGAPSVAEGLSRMWLASRASHITTPSANNNPTRFNSIRMSSILARQTQAIHPIGQRLWPGMRKMAMRIDPGAVAQQAP